jgi:hypothetical protein
MRVGTDKSLVLKYFISLVRTGYGKGEHTVGSAENLRPSYDVQTMG